MSKYTLTFYKKDPDNKLMIQQLEQIEGEDLLELCSKIPLMIINIYKKEIEAKQKLYDNDIPF